MKRRRRHYRHSRVGHFEHDFDGRMLNYVGFIGHVVIANNLNEDSDDSVA